jgi:hypothetical protein
VGWDWVNLVRRPQLGQLYKPQMTDDDECETFGGMRTGRENWSTRRKPAPVPQLNNLRIDHESNVHYTAHTYGRTEAGNKCHHREEEECWMQNTHSHSHTLTRSHNVIIAWAHTTCVFCRSLFPGPCSYVTTDRVLIATGWLPQPLLDPEPSPAPSATMPYPTTASHPFIGAFQTVARPNVSSPL